MEITFQKRIRAEESLSWVAPEIAMDVRLRL